VSLRGCNATPGLMLTLSFIAGALLSVPRPLGAQLATISAPAQPMEPAASYDTVFDELLRLEPAAGRVAKVSDLTLQRDMARFTLKSGHVYLLSPVGGRTVAAVFRGQGVFSFAPVSPIEKERLSRFEKAEALESPFTELVLFFADGTLEELEAAAKFGPGSVPGDLRGVVKRSFDYLAEKDSRTFEPDLMSAFLNGERNELFYGHIVRVGGGPLMFVLNPNEFEGVRLQSRLSRRGLTLRSETRRSEVISQFPMQGRPRDGRVKGERVRQADIRRYVIDASLPPTAGGEIAFSASATMEIAADTTVGPWVVFELFEKLRVDSARWDGGEKANVVRGKESPLLWVMLDRQIQPGESRTLRLYYHGDLIDRFVDFFRIKSSAAWYPRSLEGRSLATFDLTFTTTSNYLLASVGDRVDSSQSGRNVRTRWVTSGPIRNASFNLGLFKGHEVQETDAPPVTVMVSEESHKKLSRVFAQQRNMRERVGADVSKSLKFFQEMYGPVPVRRFYATEIPDFHGEAFPGMVHLSWVTFQNTSDQGEDEVFRAHEVAHQWWGIGVDFASYHDQWLSEGFSTFSGLWYLQTVRGSNKQYFDLLDRWKSSIMLRRAEPGPIWLGYRVTRAEDDDLPDYQTVVYQKGAWVVHMLRILALDVRTMNEDRFRAMMKEFYQKYQGKRASTEDFRAVVERHIGADMKWFFDQWIYSAAIPTYHVAHRIDPMSDGQYKVRLRVRQEDVPGSFLMYVPVTLDLGKDKVARFRVKVTGRESEVELPPVPVQPKRVLFNDLQGVLAEVKTEGWSD
jgi:hypothetical protein